MRHLTFDKVVSHDSFRQGRTSHPTRMSLYSFLGGTGIHRGRDIWYDSFRQGKPQNSPQKTFDMSFSGRAGIHWTWDLWSDSFCTTLSGKAGHHIQHTWILYSSLGRAGIHRSRDIDMILSGRAGYWIQHKTFDMSISGRAGIHWTWDIWSDSFCTTLSGKAGHWIQYTSNLTYDFRQGRFSLNVRHWIRQTIARLFQAGQDTKFDTQAYQYASVRQGRNPSQSRHLI